MTTENQMEREQAAQLLKQLAEQILEGGGDDVNLSVYEFHDPVTAPETGDTVTDGKWVGRAIVLYIGDADAPRLAPKIFTDAARQL